MNSLETLLYETNQKAYKNAKNPLKSHGPDHHWRVYQNALLLANKQGVKYDPEVLAGAALLHDMAAYYPEIAGDEYHQYDYKFAEELLAEIDFPKDKIPATIGAIANHGSDPKFRTNDESIETTLLRDADKIDVFGPIGVARIIMVRTLKGDTLEQIIDDFYTKGHLKRKWDSITSQAARDIAQADYEYSLNFFANLAESLKLDK